MNGSNLLFKASQAKFTYIAHLSNKAIQSASHKTPKAWRQSAKETCTLKYNELFRTENKKQAKMQAEIE